MVLSVASTIPLVYGWATDVKRRFMPRLSQNSLNLTFSNCCPSYPGEKLCFYLPGKIVYCNYDMLSLTRSSRKWPDKSRPVVTHFEYLVGQDFL
ncbi:hypothetical protein QYF36_025853 [Acer negundo]|nr:hypothetical protein QYF36_025853 [Acer negundo]